ncbi:MAG: ATP-binding protein [Bacilli bacterium]|nr:ATP-binding protein [Bacilli bacterium]
MLLYYKVRNYRSIEYVEVNFRFAEKKAPNGYKEREILPFIGIDSIRGVPTLALYGPNASGKTNIIKAFDTLQRIVRNRFKESLSDPNKLQDVGEESGYELGFWYKGITFQYFLSHDDRQITKEKLIVDTHLVFSIEKNFLDYAKPSEEVYTLDKLRTIFKVECLDKEKHFNTPFLSVIGKNYANLNDTITSAFTYITRNLEIYKKNDFPFDYCMTRLANGKDKKQLQSAFDRIVSILRKLDIDITKMEYQRNELNVLPDTIDKEKFEYVFFPKKDLVVETDIKSYHRNHQGDEIPLEFLQESAGTRKIACLLGIILAVLDHGHILIVDELENSIHPLLLAELIRLFKDRRYNKSNAQLVFTTHNTDVMDHELMRISEIGIVSKTSKSGTRFVRVSDFEGVRNVTRFRKQYLDGKFSGIPYPYI